MHYGTIEFLDGPRFPSYLLRVTPRGITSLALLCSVAQPFQAPAEEENCCACSMVREKAEAVSRVSRPYL